MAPLQRKEDAAGKQERHSLDIEEKGNEATKRLSSSSLVIRKYNSFE